MNWTVPGMDDATQERAQAAADAAGLSLAAWLDRAILVNADNYVLPPDEEDADGDADPLGDPAAQEAIQQVLGVLEARLQTNADNVTRLVRPIHARLDGLAGRAATETADDGEPAGVAAVPPPGVAYRRRLGILAGGFLFLAFAATGGLVWLWFDMADPPPPPYLAAEADLPLEPPQPTTHAAAQTTAPSLDISLTNAAPDGPSTNGNPSTNGKMPASLPPSELAAPTAIDIAADVAADTAANTAVPSDSISDVSAVSAPAVPRLPATPDAKPAANQRTAAKPPSPSTAVSPAVPPATPPAFAGASADLPPTQPPAALSPGDAQLVAQLRADAAKGDPKAQHDLALLLMEGRLLPRDPKTATDLFEKAAVQGLPNAQYNLGVIYDHGIGRAADQTMAYFWYSAAADQGHAAAQYNLGVAAAQGRGAPRDYDVAAVWFRRAAEGDLPDAQYNLGQLYENGLGVPLDLDMARDLYRQAADRGYTPARTRLIALEAKLQPSNAAADAAPSAPPRASGSTMTTRATTATATTATTTTTALPVAQAGLTRKDIVELQTLLRNLALTKANPDGNLGPATRTAIKQYQGMAGLEPTGEPSLDLLSELREVAGAK